jgi:hypothetical protein
MSTYERKTGVTAHAIERLRDRLNGDVKARSDEDLGNLIDHAVVTGIEINAVIEILDEGVPSKLVKLDVLPSSEPLFALVKPNDRVNYRHKLVVITLLTQEMVAVAVASGRWGNIDLKKNEEKKMTNMGSKLKGALDMAEMRGKPVAVREAPEPATPQPPLKKTSKAPATAETYLVTWKRRERDYSGGLLVHESAEYPKGEINQRVSELLDSTHVEAKSIRIWREVKTRVKVEVDVDE